MRECPFFLCVTTVFQTIDHWVLDEMTIGTACTPLSNLYPGPCPRPRDQFLPAFPGGEANFSGVRVSLGKDELEDRNHLLQSLGLIRQDKVHKIWY